MPKPLFLFVLLAWACVASPLFAEEAWQKWVTPFEFRALAEKTAHNVELFQKIWETDPDAALYGGTSRDFLWFLRKKLSRATSADDLKRIAATLSARAIDAREFIVGNSDVDVITDQRVAEIDFDEALITRIEPISPEWFRLGHPRFEQEARQGVYSGGKDPAWARTVFRSRPVSTWVTASRKFITRGPPRISIRGLPRPLFISSTKTTRCFWF